MIILVLEIFLISVKNNPKNTVSKIFTNEFLYTAYDDDTTFFLKSRISIIELMNELNIKYLILILDFSGPKPKKKKCKIAGIGVLNRVQMILCDMKCVNLNNETVKILGVHLSHNKNFEQDKNFCEHIVKTENDLKLWRMTQLTLRGRIMVFKSLIASEVIIFYLLLNYIIIHLIFYRKYRKMLFGKGKRQKLNTVLFAMTMTREVYKMST